MSNRLEQFRSCPENDTSALGSEYNTSTLFKTADQSMLLRVQLWDFSYSPTVLAGQNFHFHPDLDKVPMRG